MKSNGKATDKPVVTVTRLDPIAQGSNIDWYTPKIAKVHPQTVIVVVGKKGKGRVRCEIQEGEWERRHFDLTILLEKVKVPGRPFYFDFHSTVDNDFGGGVRGTMNREHIGRLIIALTTVRDEAERRGLFTARPTPTILEEAFVEHLLGAGGTRGGIGPKA